MRLKAEIRILGIDDAFFNSNDDNVLIIGVIFRGGFWIDGLLSTTIAVDGLDATDKLIDMVNYSKYKDLRIIMLSGVTFGGFNVVDIARLSEETGLPVIAVTERHPNFDKIYSAVQNVSKPQERIDIMKRAGDVYHAHNEVCFQVHGIDVVTARSLIRKTSTHSNIPEPLRVSHIIASGLTRGEASKR